MLPSVALKALPCGWDMRACCLAVGGAAHSYGRVIPDGSNGSLLMQGYVDISTRSANEIWLLHSCTTALTVHARRGAGAGKLLYVADDVCWSYVWLRCAVKVAQNLGAC